LINLQGSFKMKNTTKIIFIFFAFLSVQTIYAQKATLKKANQLFQDRSYIEASKMYLQLPNTKEKLENLGDSYYFTSQMLLASKVYTQLYDLFKDEIQEVHLFRYANSLKALEEFERADKIMGEYLKFPVDTKKFLEHLVKIVPYNYQLSALSRTVGGGDFGISFYGDSIVFASVRNKDNPIYSWNQKPYLNLFMGTISDEGVLENIKAFSDSINTKTHESNAIFTKDLKTMYFNRTNSERYEVNGQWVATVKIFKSEFKNGGWNKATELPFCSNQFSTMHPALSADEKRLFFSSDMPGTLGSMDIFYVDIQEDGSYGIPTNLGKTINTPNLEQFPFIDEKGTLYFSSDGHQGLGGLDIFMSRSFDDNFIKPINLGPTINSGFDDFSYVIKAGEETGYMASSKTGEDILYRFARFENERLYAVSGTVRDKYTKNLIPGTKINLYNEKDELIGQILVGVDADYIFNVEPNTTYRIEAFKDLYIPYIEEFTTNDEGKLEYIIEMSLESYDDAEEIVITKDDGLTYIVLENIYFDFNKWDITDQAASTLNVLVDLLKKYPYMEIELGAHTDSRATDAYNMRLSHNRAAAALEYLVNNGINRKRLKSKGYGERKPLVSCGSDCTEDEHSINRRCEFIILK
jgi:peptidoglycan-associated lipoprotein